MRALVALVLVIWALDAAGWLVFVAQVTFLVAFFGLLWVMWKVTEAPPPRSGPPRRHYEEWWD